MARPTAAFRTEIEVEIGLRYPYEALGEDVGLHAAFAKTAEDLGFRFLAFVDHVLGAEHARRDPPFEGPYHEESVFHEPMTLMAWLAANTEQIELTTSVLVLPQRQAVLAAKQAAEVQLLSHGRLRLGVGIGWNYVEYESLGVPYRDRGALLEEQVGVMRALWTERLLDYEGRFHRVDRAGFRPLLGSPIPIWFGGFSDAQQDRCARIGDGFTFMRTSRLAVEAVANIKRKAAALGRDPDSLGFETIGFDAGAALLADIEQWAAAGGTHIGVMPHGDGADLLDGLGQIARDLGGLLIDGR
jgi:probable F420-dependent oxidoreductase